MFVSFHFSKVKLDGELLFSENLAALNPLFNLDKKTKFKYLIFPLYHHLASATFLCHQLVNIRKIIFFVNCTRMQLLYTETG